MKDIDARDGLLAALSLRAEGRRLKANWAVRQGTPKERFNAIVYLWHDKHGHTRPQG